MLKIQLSPVARVATTTIAFFAAAAPSQVAGQGQKGSPLPYIQWPLPDQDRAYGAIDGKHISQYVVEQADISRRYRDQGHPQYWGRIAGTSGDAESAEWLLKKFQNIGMTDTRIQSLDMPPVWIPKSFDVKLSGEGKTVTLASAQPAVATYPTPPDGLDLEAVYVGLGREADFVRHNVRGKAVFVFNLNEEANYGGRKADALKRAEKNGAVVVFAVSVHPGNTKIQAYPVDTNIPTFTLALSEGEAVRDMIARSQTGAAPHIKVVLNVEMVPDSKTALVWGTLPGATDETIYVVGHRDGWFDAAGDNGGGVASMLGLAEYFAKVPKARRRRTMVFIGLDGHHDSCVSTVPSKWCQPGSIGIGWLTAHKDQLFSKTALMINDEHPANVETYAAGDHSSASEIGSTDTYFPQEWYAGGPSRPNLTKIAADAFREFGVTVWSEPSPAPPAGDLGGFSKFLPGVASSSDRFFYFHADTNTPETVPWTGLESTTRAYAKIIDQVNKLDIKDLQLPESK